MKDGGYCRIGPPGFEMCASPDSSNSNSILNLRYSELPNSEYNYFLYGFLDERDFEEFKHDLRDFQKLKGEGCSDVADGCGDSDMAIDLKELQIICRPNYVCKNRRGRASRNVNKFKHNSNVIPNSTIRPSSRFPVPTSVDLSDESIWVEGEKISKDNSEHVRRSLRDERSDSFGRRADFKRSSSVLGVDKTSAVDSSIGQILGDFFNGDEHFQEFERVFEKIRNRRVSKDLDTNPRHSSKRRSRSCVKVNNYGEDRTSTDVPHLSSSSVSDIFADFFDNDETFLEFEKEFNNFRSNRRSNFLESSSNGGKSQDILQDVDIDCDKNMNSNCGCSASYSSTTIRDGTVSVCRDAVSYRSPILHSADAWKEMFQQMKTQLPLDLECLHRHKQSANGLTLPSDRQHRHSVHGLTEPSDGQHRHSVHGLTEPSDGQHRHSVHGLTEPSDGQHRHSVHGLTEPSDGQHRHSVHGLTEPSVHNKERNKTQSLTLDKDQLNCLYQHIHSVYEPPESSEHSGRQHRHSVHGLSEPSDGQHRHSVHGLTEPSDGQHRHSVHGLSEPSDGQHRHSVHGLSEPSDGQHIHSVHGLTEPSKYSGGQHKIQSLADLSQCHMNDPFRDLSSKSKSLIISKPDSGLIQRPSSLNFQTKPKFQQDVTPGSLSLTGVYACADASSMMSDTTASGSSYSPISPHCYSPSCFCYSDLHIEEEGDAHSVSCGLPSPASGRCQPLMKQCFDQLGRQSFGELSRQSLEELGSQSLEELWSQSTCEEHGLPSNSFVSSQYLNGNRGSETLMKNSHVQVTSSGQLNTSQSGGIDLDNNLIVSDRKWDRSSSATSSDSSDPGSECYHTARSDLSGPYLTAESRLSVFVEKSESEFNDLDISFHSSEAASPQLSGLPECGFVLPERQKDNSIIRGQFSIYRDSERRRDRFQKDRPRSESACQYTCHQHCVPAVTLNCKTVSGEGGDVSPARATGASDPRYFLETRGNIHARPGGAVFVPSPGTNTASERAPRASESVPNFQQISQGMGKGISVHPELGHRYGDTPRPSSFSSHHRSWSVSENYVTAHSSHLPHLGQVSSPSPETSQVQLTSSPQRLPSYSVNLPGTLQHKNTTRQSPPHSYSPASDHAGASINKHTQENINTTSLEHNTKDSHHTSVECTKDTTTLDFSDVFRRDDDTNPDATTEKDETDSGYRSGTIPDDKLPRVPSQTTLDQQELQRKVVKYNHFVPAVSLEVTGKESFQGFLKVAMNLIRPITMELGARPPSIYELLTREHIVEENTQQVAFYMPRDTHKSLHITSDTTTKEVITSLLKKFHILDHPRKFAMYEQEFNDRNKLVRLRRLTDKDHPLRAMVNWQPERIRNYRMVLQENETGEIVWDAFSLPELNNFMKVLEREEKETILDLRHKYAYMKQYIDRRLIELRGDGNKKANDKI